MRLRGLCVVCGFALATAGVAQSTDRSILLLPTGTASCPVAVEAEHKAGGGELLARNGAQSGPAQQLRLTITNRKASAIAGIGLTVHGPSGRGQLEDARSVAPLGAAAGDIVRHVYLPLRIASQQHSATELVLPRFTAIRYLELDSVTFVDGNVWHAASGGRCRFYPSGFMLVDGR